MEAILPLYSGLSRSRHDWSEPGGTTSRFTNRSVITHSDIWSPHAMSGGSAGVGARNFGSPLRQTVASYRLGSISTFRAFSTWPRSAMVQHDTLPTMLTSRLSVPVWDSRSTRVISSPPGSEVYSTVIPCARWKPSARAVRRPGNGGPATTTRPSWRAAAWTRAHSAGSGRAGPALAGALAPAGFAGAAALASAGFAGAAALAAAGFADVAPLGGAGAGAHA